MASKKFPAIVAALGICMMAAFNVDAATYLSNDPDYLNMADKKGNVINSFTTASAFIEDFAADHFIPLKSAYSFTSDDLFAGPYSLLVTGAAYKDSISETYGKLLASLGLMALIAYRRSYI